MIISGDGSASRTHCPLLYPNPQMMSETIVRPSASDSSFFTKPKTTKNAERSSATATSGGTGGTKPIVVTRVVTVRKPAEKSTTTQPHPTQSASQSRESTPGTTKKRKSQDTQSAVRPAAKKSRTTSPPNDRVAGPSRSQTPVQTPKTRELPRASSSRTPEPATAVATSRSRSVTAVPNDAVRARGCWITEGGTPGPNFKSCEQVVKEILKQYKTRKSGTSRLRIYQLLCRFQKPCGPERQVVRGSRYWLSYRGA